MNRKIKKNVYLDHNATTPISPEVLRKLPEWLENWGNPSSVHQHGRGAKSLLAKTRSELASKLGCSPLELVFTSGGSESNNLAIKGIFLNPSRPKTKNHILIGATEHPSVIKVGEFLKKQGAEIEYIEVSRNGEIDLVEFERKIKNSTLLCSMMYSNNETGIIYPIKKMAKISKSKGIYFHTDAVQALGKIPVNVRNLGVDMASFSGHKINALKGCGILYVKKGVSIESLIHGGGQERGRRAGTENLLSYVSMNESLPELDCVIKKNNEVQRLRDNMEEKILSQIKGCEVLGSTQKRLPNTSSIVITGIDGETLLMNLDIEGFSVSTGSACSSGAQEPSRALQAMGLSRLEAQSTLRVSTSGTTTEQELNEFVDTLVHVVNRIRKIKIEDGKRICEEEHAKG